MRVEAPCGTAWSAARALLSGWYPPPGEKAASQQLFQPAPPPRVVLKQSSECGWCCSSGRCTTAGFPGVSSAEKCSPYSWLPPGLLPFPPQKTCLTWANQGSFLHYKDISNKHRREKNSPCPNTIFSDEPLVRIATFQSEPGRSTKAFFCCSFGNFLVGWSDRIFP